MPESSHNSSPSLVRVDQLAHADLGKAIAFFRKKQGLTQAQLGDRCGMTQTAICRLERDPKNVKLGVIDRVRRELGVTYADLTEPQQIVVEADKAGLLSVGDVFGVRGEARVRQNVPLIPWERSTAQHVNADAQLNGIES
jgi:transcriptional regulator with XRE-family HTH domain